MRDTDDSSERMGDLDSGDAEEFEEGEPSRLGVSDEPLDSEIGRAHV